MKKQLVIIGIVALLVSVGLSGCNQVSNTINPERGKFVGTWKGIEIYMGYSSNVSLTCLSDGTFSAGKLLISGGTWDLIDNKFILKFSESGISTYDYVFSNNDKSLNLTSTTIDNQFILIKQ